MSDEILYLGIKRDYDTQEWVICEEHVDFYRVLCEYSTFADAESGLRFFRRKRRYAHLDKDGFAPGVCEP